MPTPPRQPNDWNSFQRLHKGKWTRDELKRQWQLCKQLQSGQGSVSCNTTKQLSALKQGIKALMTAKTALNQTKGVIDAANVRAFSTSTADQAASSPSRAVVDVGDVLLSRTSPSSSTATVCSFYASCNSTPASDHKRPNSEQQSQHSQQVEEESCAGHSPAVAAEVAATATPPGITLQDESSSFGSVPAQELAKLREAVHHLLARQAASQPAHSQPESAAQPPPWQTQQQQLWCHRAHAASGPAAAVVSVAGSGCLGQVWGQRQLSWNAFQKACKGRGLCKSEISAAYQHAKGHYLRTGELLDLDSYLPLQQMIHCTERTHQQQQQVQAGGKWSSLQHWLQSHTASRTTSTAVSPSSSPAQHTRAAGMDHSQYRPGSTSGDKASGRRSGLQQWLQSRTASRAASRTVSRACSTVVSPSSSPAAAQQGSQPGHAGGGRGGGRWGAFKEWVHSRGSSRAGSRLGTPAASPGQRHLSACAQEQQQDGEQRLMQTPVRQWQPEQQQQQRGKWTHVGREVGDDASYLPFAEQLLRPAGPVSGQHHHQQQQGCDQQQQQLQRPERIAEPAPLPTFLPGGHQGPQQDILRQQQQWQQQDASGCRSQVSASSAGEASANSSCSAAKVCATSGASHACSTGAAGAARVDSSSSSSSAGVQEGLACESGTANPRAPAAVIACCAAVTVLQAATGTPAAAAAAATSEGPAAVCGIRVGHRLARESVADDALRGLVEGFCPWVAVDPRQLRQLMKAVPRKPGLYEWGVRLPRRTAIMLTSDCLGTVDGRPAGGGGMMPAQQFGRVLAFYLGKAGTLRPQRPRRSVTHYGPLGYTGETLRTRLGKYARSGRLGPLHEPHKDAFFQQQLQVGGQLCLRWCVCSSVEPLEAETHLLNRLDYAANYQNNRGRRPLFVSEHLG